MTWPLCFEKSDKKSFEVEATTSWAKFKKSILVNMSDKKGDSKTNVHHDDSIALLCAIEMI